MEPAKVHPEFSKAAQATQSSFKLFAAIVFCLVSIIPTFVEAEAEKEKENGVSIENLNNKGLMVAQLQEVDATTAKK